MSDEKGNATPGKGEAADAFWAEFWAIIKVFGETPPVIVACKLGEKVPRYPYKRGLTDILDDYRLSVIKEAFLEGGNLAALLGRESQHLCVIDFDRDDLIEPFLILNPAFSSTLRTRGSKGAAFWFYAESEHYPACVKRFEIDGNSAGTGEFRGAELAIFFGLNKAQKPYQRLVDAPVIRFDYSRIVWPPNWRFVATRERIKATDASGNPIERKPFSGKPGEVDWDAIRELTENNDGDINDGLVSRYWPRAKWDGREWRCANIGGEKRRNKGSFYITIDGFAGDFDGSYPRTTIVTAIFSKERFAATGEKVTLRDFIQTVKGATGIDFSPKQLPILYLPSLGFTTRPEAAENCYKGLAATQEYFLRDDNFVYPEESKEGEGIEEDENGEDAKLGIVLRPMDEWQLLSDLERVFRLERKKWDKKKECETSVLAECTLPEAKTILKDRRAMVPNSLPLRLIAASPVLIEKGGKSEVLQKGYHRQKGGIYVLNDLEIPELTLKEAVAQLTDRLFADYDFTNEPDYSRAIAQVLSPAMKLGGLLGGADFPLDVALADEPQSGKTHRMKFTARIYGERAYSLTKTEGGVGSLDETIATALLSGRLFILCDNVRGTFDSQLLESILRGDEQVSARVPHLKAVLAHTGRSVWQLTSNSAHLTLDLTRRSIITSHRKQLNDYTPALPWGEHFIQHVVTKQALYLGAVHAVLRDWINRGKPRTGEARHAFTDWTQSMDWIVQNTFGKPPLMDDHYTAVLTDKYTVWLRQVVLAIKQSGTGLPITYQAYHIREICETNGIEIPGVTPGMDTERANKQVGSCMGKIFEKTESGEVKIEEYSVVRNVEKRLPGIHHETKTYTFRRRPSKTP